MNEIKMISADELYPHPDNPRKNLGDLSELRDSIKENGIMQNLVVAPGHIDSRKQFQNDGYTVICGHRRRAAGILADLKEFPCVIKDGLTDAQAMAMMLQENMQRNGLAIDEQAYGFQYMFDLGESVADISRNTGFAETTVRRRLKIAELDRKKLKDALEGNGGYQFTLKDLEKLEKVSSREKRNEILAKCGAAYQLDGMINSAAHEEEVEKAVEILKPLFDSAGIREDVKRDSAYSYEYETVEEFDIKKLPEKPALGRAEGKDSSRLVWLRPEGTYNDIIRIKKKVRDDAKKQEETEEEKKEQKERKERVRKLEGINAAMRDELQTFIASVYTGRTSLLSSKIGDQYEAAERLYNLMQITGAYVAADRVEEAIDELGIIDRGGYTDEEYKKLLSIEAADAANGGKWLHERMMLDILPELMNMRCFDYYDGRYSPGAAAVPLAAVSQFKYIYGFEWSKPEFDKILDGTHELYPKKEDGE